MGMDRMYDSELWLQFVGCALGVQWGIARQNTHAQAQHKASQRHSRQMKVWVSALGRITSLRASFLSYSQDLQS